MRGERKKEQRGESELKIKGRRGEEGRRGEGRRIERLDLE